MLIGVAQCHQLISSLLYKIRVSPVICNWNRNRHDNVSINFLLSIIISFDKKNQAADHLFIPRSFHSWVIFSCVLRCAMYVPSCCMSAKTVGSWKEVETHCVLDAVVEKRSGRISRLLI